MKHLLSIEDLDRDAIERILDRAAAFAEVSGREIKKVPTLRGRTDRQPLLRGLHQRRRAPFELAAKRLSADVVSIRSVGSSVDKGESLKDTVQTLSRLRPRGDRHPLAQRRRRRARRPLEPGERRQRRRRQARAPDAGAARRLHPAPPARLARGHEHLDRRRRPALARRPLRRHRLPQDGRAGDGVRPADAASRAASRRSAARWRSTLDRLGEADVVYALRMQNERMSQAYVPSLREYVSHYQIDGRRLHPRQLLMHPGPVNRGIELSGEVIDSPQALIGQQVEAGVVVRMAVLYELLAGGERDGRAPARGRPRPRAPGAPARMSLYVKDAPPADLLIRGAHVIDPREGIDDAARRARPGRRDRRARRARARWKARRGPSRSTAPAVTCCPASSTRTSTCARPATSTRRTSTPARAPPPRAGSSPSSRCPTPSRPSTTPAVLRSLIDAAAPRGARPRRLPVRGHARPEGRGAHRHGRAARGRRARLHRRRPARPRRRACCAARSSTSTCAAARSRSTRRTRPCRATARCTRARCLRCSGSRGSRRSPSRRWSPATGRSPPTRTRASTSSTCPRWSRSAALTAAKEAGAKVTGEATPHHLTLTDEAVRSLDTRMKMNPPLRSEEDRQALITALRNGTIDCVATDHAPHAREEKEVPVRGGADGHDRPRDRVRGAQHRARAPRAHRPRAARRAHDRRRRALRPARPAR